jgi:hypothetical protein
MDKIYTNIENAIPAKDLFRTVPVPPQPRQPVDIPGVLNQTRNLFRPYTGRDAKDKS